MLLFDSQKWRSSSAYMDQADNNISGTALMYASANGHSACVEVLLRASASVDQAEDDGDTALMAASLEIILTD